MSKKTNYSGYYASTHDFVSVNKLEEEAEKVFGKDWEADDDINQTQELVDSTGESYCVKHIKENTARDTRSDNYIHVLKTI
jgi:hypothetical protein